jgi:prolyl oligopeptidase
MKYLFPGILILATMSCSSPTGFSYPETRKEPVTDTYHGTEVADPYRWLEDDRSEETEAWVKAQNEVTFSYLDHIPFRDELRERMTRLWNYPRMSAPDREGDLYFYSYNSGLQNQSIIYLKEDLESEGKVFLDPNKLSEDGTVALSTYSVSRDQKYFAYGISRGGSDWQEFFIREIASGRDLDDDLRGIKFSGISGYKDGVF